MYNELALTLLMKMKNLRVIQSRTENKSLNEMVNFPRFKADVCQMSVRQYPRSNPGASLSREHK